MESMGKCGELTTKTCWGSFFGIWGEEGIIATDTPVSKQKLGIGWTYIIKEM